MKQRITKEQCIKCKIEKSVSEFYVNKGNKSGYDGSCKKCRLEYRKWYRENKQDKDKNRAYQCNWARKFRKENPQKNYAIVKRWVCENKEKVNKMRRNWCKNNPDKIANIKANRYAREKGAKGSYTLREWEGLKELCDNCCAACGKMVRLTKDHIVPLVKNGTNYINNIQPLCRNCNCSKGDKIICYI